MAFPGFVQVVKAVVSGVRVADLPPDAFLGVEPGMVGRQVVQVKVGVRGEERSHQRPFVPGGAIHKQVNHLPAHPCAQALQQGEEGLCIAFGPAHQPMSARERGHPTEDVAPLAVFTAGGYPDAPAPVGPDPAEAGMFGEVRLIFENEEVPFSQAAEFFLPGEGTSRLLRLWPFAGLGAARRNAAAGAPPRWDRPTPLGAGRSAPAVLEGAQQLVHRSCGSDAPMGPRSSLLGELGRAKRQRRALDGRPAGEARAEQGDPSSDHRRGEWAGVK